MPLFNDKRDGSTSDLSAGRYAVQKGDSVWAIAEKNKPAGMSTAKYYTSVLNANKGNFKSGDPNKIYSGERLNLPGQKTKPIKPKVSADGYAPNALGPGIDAKGNSEINAGTFNKGNAGAWSTGTKTKAAQAVDARKTRLANSGPAGVFGNPANKGKFNQQPAAKPFKFKGDLSKIDYSKAYSTSKPVNTAGVFGNPANKGTFNQQPAAKPSKSESSYKPIVSNQIAANLRKATGK